MHFVAADVGAITAFLTPGVLGPDAVIRTPKKFLALPPLHCKVEQLEFAKLRPQLGEALDIERKLVGRFLHICNADSQQKVKQAIETIPEQLALTDEELLVASTGKATFVTEFCGEKHAGAEPSAAEKTIIYSLYNSELYIAVSELQRAGWVDYGSAFASDWHLLEEHLHKAARILGYEACSWPNLPQDILLELPSWFRLDTTKGQNQQSAALTLGFSADHWPPTQFDTEQWRTNRRKYAAVADADQFAVGISADIARQQSFQDFKNNDDIQVLCMDAVGTVRDPTTWTILQ